MKKAISINTFLIAILTLLISEQSFSQVTQQWVSRYNGAGNTADQPVAMVLDNSGNIYVTGRSWIGTFTDYTTIKINPAGALLWSAKYNGPANKDDESRAIAVDGSGNVYVTGLSYNTLNGDCVTIKYNSNGDSVWVKRYGSDAFDAGNSIAADNLGNVYVAATSVGSGTGQDYATIKYNSIGDTLWVRRCNPFTNSDEFATSIHLDDSNNVYVTGISWGGKFVTVKYDSEGVLKWTSVYNGPEFSQNGEITVMSDIDQYHNIYITGRSLGTGTNFDYATIKYNSAGVQQWAARYNGTGNYLDFPYGIKADGSGNVYVTGRSDGSGTGEDFATIKYNSSGEQQWVKRYNSAGGSGDGATSLGVDATGNIYVTGYSSGNGTSLDYVTIKYNSNGDQIWKIVYDNGSGISAYDLPKALVLDNTGNIFVTGASTQNISEDFCTIKYTQSVGIRQISSGVPEQFSLSQNYPNPFNPSTKISYELRVTNYVLLKVYDVLGNEVKTLVNEKQNAGTYEVSFDASNFSSGSYFYKLVTNGFIETKKMFLIK
ncbi:MAG: SBBP repeat-containing protein [Ignavibacteria bacterium]|nr:SBBP repeat-containing protein [Ignavibacteria bacterium]